MPIRPRTPQRAARPGLLRHWTLWVWFALALVLCVGGVSLWKSGRWLIHEDPYEHARWAVVLGGESRDLERSDAAIRLYHEGKIDTIILSTTRIFKNRYISEFLVDYYVQQGVPRDRIFEFRQDAYSTQEEARLLVRQFRLMNLDSVLIITSTFHTARSRRIFRKLSGGYPVVKMTAADYNVYDPNAFWSNRESLKLWFDEWVKSFFTMLELAKDKPVTEKAEFQGLTPDIWSSRTPAEFPAPTTSPAADSIHAPAVKNDSAEAQPSSATDSAKEGSAGTVEAKAEPKTALDSAVAAKADSLKVRQDSVKAHKDSLKAKAAEEKAAAAAKEAEKKIEAKEAEVKKSGAKTEAKLEAKAAAKDSVARKTLPRAPKKPSAPVAKAESKDAKKAATPAKESSKSSDKKTEKTKLKKKE